MLKSKLLGATAAAQALAIEDVFSTYLYTGNGSTQTITNDIDLAGEGGLVWIKSRNTISSTDHHLFDTVRGNDTRLISNNTSASTFIGAGAWVPSSSGFSCANGYPPNYNGDTYASWTFRKAPRFFDCVEYTGDGASSQTINHNLGTEVGSLIIKKTSETGGWYVYHRSLGNNQALELQETVAAYNNVPWGSVTSTTFEARSDILGNDSGVTYVAYLFAHDPLGPSGDGSDGLIACGSYTGNGSTDGPEIDLGWEPQWVLVKNATTSVGNWNIADVMRGMPVGSNTQLLAANTTDAEGGIPVFVPQPTGFKVVDNNEFSNGSGNTFIYIAIRRGPMRTPTSGTEVFEPVTSQSATGTKLTTGFPVDMQIQKIRSQGGDNYLVSRLTGVGTLAQSGEKYLITNSTAAEASASLLTRNWDNTGYETPSGWNNFSTAYWNFRRAPGFFDVVAYTGQSGAQVINHNLGVVPEMIWIKKRSEVSYYGFVVYHGTTGNMYLSNAFSSGYGGSNAVNHSTISDTTFQLANGNIDVNDVGETHIAYLFATLPGVSKVGSYTGNGSSQTIDCGFTSGARFVLIKKSSGTGDWWVFDTARGIVSGNDPALNLNTTSAEDSNYDMIDPDGSGFIVTTAGYDMNASGDTYIFYAVS